MKRFTSGERRFIRPMGSISCMRVLFAAVDPFGTRDLARRRSHRMASWAFQITMPRAPYPDGLRRLTLVGAQLAMLLLACLRGNIFLYQGEELGSAPGGALRRDLRDPKR